MALVAGSRGAGDSRLVALGEAGAGPGVADADADKVSGAAVGEDLGGLRLSPPAQERAARARVIDQAPDALAESRCIP